VKVLSTLRANALKLLCVVIVTLLVALKVQYNDVVEKLDSATTSLTKHEQLNQRLSDENKRLIDDLEKKPKEVIKIVTEVQTELCDVKVKDSAIKNLKSSKEVTDEKDVADIDDRLPADLKQLLK
jgi:predicted signal transduction protein with EAL and GGDEF domain